MRRLLTWGAALAAVAGITASGADAAQISQYEIRPGVPALQFTADPGEANDVTLSSSNNANIDTTVPGASTGARAITIADLGAPLRVSGPPCRLLTPNVARCRLAAPGLWSTVTVDLGDRADRLRMAARPFGPAAQIAGGGAGDRFALRGPNTWVTDASDGDRVRFLPPGGGGVIVGGSPRLWLVDGAAEYVDCRTPGDPRVFTDPFDELSYYCTV
jgi:hypothetical protein